ncbi:MAG TPA: hypothetical protein VHA56_14680 [Mucilaginibacter sp.]|nr:hypothetical protein [Mucilaginibacter sp.]
MKGPKAGNNELMQVTERIATIKAELKSRLLFRLSFLTNINNMTSVKPVNKVANETSSYKLI